MVDVASREAVHALAEQAAGCGNVLGLIHAAGVSPSQASPDTVLHVDRYATVLVLEERGNVMAPGGSDVVISSQAGHRLPALSEAQKRALALTPTEELLKLPFLRREQGKDSLQAYQLAKRGNSLRVMAEAVRWGKRAARVNAISPGIVTTPLANDELDGPRGGGYRKMIEGSVAKRAGTPDEVGAVGALLERRAWREPTCPRAADRRYSGAAVRRTRAQHRRITQAGTKPGGVRREASEAAARNRGGRGS